MLASNSELTAPDLELVVLNSAQINAFAVPGGVIGLNAGLLLHARSEDELAAVIAHELAHLSQRHFARGLEAGQQAQWTNLAALLASVVIAATAGGEAGMAALATTQAASIEQQLRFSRHNESEADRVGIQTLVQAELDPHAMPGFFEQLLQSTRYSGTKPPEFLLTHPVTQSRISDSRNRASTYPSRAPSNNLEFYLMKVRTVVEFSRDLSGTIKDLETKLQEQKTQNAEVTRFGLAHAYLKANQLDKALEQINLLLTNRTNRITYAATKAEILKTQGNYDEAEKLLRQELEFSPKNYPLSVALAETLLRNNKAQKANAALKELLERYSGRPYLWYLLSESYGKQKAAIGAHESRAEYFFLNGQTARALEQLKFGLAEAKSDYNAEARIKRRIDQIQASKEDLKL